MIEESGGLDKPEELQNKESEQHFMKALEMLAALFLEEEGLDNGADGAGSSDAVELKQPDE